MENILKSVLKFLYFAKDNCYTNQFLMICTFHNSLTFLPIYIVCMYLLNLPCYSIKFEICNVFRSIFNKIVKFIINCLKSILEKYFISLQLEFSIQYVSGKKNVLKADLGQLQQVG